MQTLKPKQRKYHIDGSAPKPMQVFVFGSNLGGVHGAGAALAAHRFYGAKLGVAEGMAGRSYAIPTKDASITRSLSLKEIKASVDRFLTLAHNHPEVQFMVTRIGCVLAGHKDKDIAPMFREAPENCSLPDKWRKFVE